MDVETENSAVFGRLSLRFEVLKSEVFKETDNRPLVAVAMSGGVDSSVAAALLLEQGYRVVGLTMKLWEYDAVGGNVHAERSCCSLEGISDAARVAAQLGIPHYTVDVHEAFEKDVVQNFIEEYRRGRTPNPCVLCNVRTKWDVLRLKARALGARYFATGHYARVKRNLDTGRVELWRAADKSKDQSYALWALRQDQLAETLLPLGELTKETTRKMAERLGLRTATKPDSQEICFVPDNDYRRFLRERGEPERVGEIVDTAGNVLGHHRGTTGFTIGQRRGLGIAVGRPVYVVDIDPERNRVVVGDREELLSRGLIATGVNWVAIPELERPTRAWVKIRYRDRGSWATLYPAEEAGAVRVEFDEPQAAVTPGQSAVFYDGDRVLGGGFILSRL